MLFNNYNFEHIKTLDIENVLAEVHNPEYYDENGDIDSTVKSEMVIYEN